MYRKILDYIRQNHLLVYGDRVITALSGGADSVCLLVILNELKEVLGIELKSVHVHHGIRGAEADRDCAYAKELSERLRVPFVCHYVDAVSYGREHNMSVEEAGRHLRYEIFEKERLSFGGTKIAVAHHGDDQAETILHHLFRGSGLKGLGGIRPLRGFIVRPLLCVRRNEILAYLEEKGICYCEDSTNALSDYARNRLRLEILPSIEREINTRAAENIIRAGSMAAQADAYLESQASGILKERGMWQKDENGVKTACGMKSAVLMAEAEIIRSYLIRAMIHEVSGSMKDMGCVHVESAAALLFGPSGRQADLPYSLCAQRIQEELWIKKKKKDWEVDNTESFPLPELEFLVFPYEKGQEIPKNGYTKWFDYDKIKCTLTVRHRQTGDYITLSGGGRKSVKAYMIDEKIPREERERIPLVADGSHVLWIIGYRISEYYKITDDTHTVIQIQSDGGKNNGR